MMIIKTIEEALSKRSRISNKAIKQEGEAHRKRRNARAPKVNPYPFLGHYLSVGIYGGAGRGDTAMGYLRAVHITQTRPPPPGSGRPPAARPDL
ncbi:hypothetical protein EVAR_47771_1 [Eumeta japonica]|uniref:Uncharacterized protein n=1 Tax=Eumeta variegata TaxID=151549 RepID=A0A4C1XVS0_EUMVA|nr:hypothetical protein EVAR_47771_1 [Eumeta japonica]